MAQSYQNGPFKAPRIHKGDEPGEKPPSGGHDTAARDRGQTGLRSDRRCVPQGPCLWDLRMRSWNTEYRVSLGGIENFPLTIRSFAPSSKGCCRKHSKYKMQPRACGESGGEGCAGGGGGGGQGGGEGCTSGGGGGVEEGYSLFWGLDPQPRTVKTQLTCGRWSHTLI